MKKHYIGLMAGLYSNGFFPLFNNWQNNRYSKWARKLESRLAEHYSDRSDVFVSAFSSDGKAEASFFKAVDKARSEGTLGVLTGAGHSKGSAEWLREASTTFRDVEIPYLGILDMTLLDGYLDGKGATGNIKILEEFHGILQYVDFDPSFKEAGSKHILHETGLGHVACANDPGNQQRIFDGIVRVIPGPPLVG